MNKFAIVLGAAAVAVVAGCMDPDYVPPSKRGAQNAPKPAAGEPATPILTSDVRPVADDLPGSPSSDTKDDIEISVASTGCQCLPGTVHETKCQCGAPDCKCEVAAKPLPTAGATASAQTDAAADTTTVYVVRPGDTLSIISRRFNIKLDSIRKANPQLKGDNIRVGQKLTLPVKVELGEYAAPVAKPAEVKKPAGPYTGATREYVVKNGDCVSKLAKANGITTKQLLDLNGLSDANIRIGQKLKLPAGVAAAAVAAGQPAVEVKKPAVEKKEQPKKAEVKPQESAALSAPALSEPGAVESPAGASVAEEKPAAETAAAETAAPASSKDGEDYISYVVLKGEDITALSISFGIDPSVIRELNNMGDNDQLVPGQTIRLPPDVQ